MGRPLTRHTYFGATLGATMREPTVSTAEVARFDALASRWWDPNGPMQPLHRMNPARIGWIAARIPTATRVLDVGCGAGLAAEALAKLGHDVLGIDAAGEAIEAARLHAAGQGLSLEYRAGLAEDLVAERRHFPVITCLEVIEHVPDPAAFVRVLASLLEPGGRLFLSTLNRTSRSYVTAKLGAEYVLRMLPVGTHDWKQFVTPSELGSYLRGAGLRVADSAGLVPVGLTGHWRTSRDMAVNYLMMAER